MKTKPNKQTYRIIDGPERHRAMLRVSSVECRVSRGRSVGAWERRSVRASEAPKRSTLRRSTLYALTLHASRSRLHAPALPFLLSAFCFLLFSSAPAAIITGNLTDLSLGPLNTTLQFN